MQEQINHPVHYGGDTVYEAIKVIEAWNLDFCLGNTVKYISRAGKKDCSKTVEDLKKAKWYLDRKISQLENNNSCSDGSFQVIVRYVPSTDDDKWWYKDCFGQTFEVMELTEEEFKNTGYMYDSLSRQAKDFYKVVNSNGMLILKTHCIKK